MWKNRRTFNNVKLHSYHYLLLQITKINTNKYDEDFPSVPATIVDHKIPL